MNIKKTVALLILMTAFIITGCTTKSAKPSPSGDPIEINISAAASMTEALKEIQVQYESENNHILQFNFGGSGALQKQIEEGAPCDLFISASNSNMDSLEEKGLILTESRKDLLGNELVLIGSKEMKEKLNHSKALPTDDVKSIAIGTPESVPAGKYAKETLTQKELWEKIQSKLILAKDVKQVLEYVETGNSDCGFVYMTDAKLLKTGFIVEEDFSDSHSPILYPAALIKDSPQLEAAQSFYDFLQTDYAKSVFEKYGFVVLN